jgi:hypothetical protein
MPIRFHGSIAPYAIEESPALGVLLLALAPAVLRTFMVALAALFATGSAAGEKLQSTFAGSPWHARSTVWLKPSCGVTCTVTGDVWPGCNATDELLSCSEIVPLGAGIGAGAGGVGGVGVGVGVGLGGVGVGCAGPAAPAGFTVSMTALETELPLVVPSPAKPATSVNTPA